MLDIVSLAQRWLDLDNDVETKNEITDLLAAGDHGQLELRLRTRIAFGTAGLRARMEAGFSRMNSLTVIQASQGLAHYVIEQSPDAKNRGIVIGRDARHNSEKFARLAAAAFITKGIKVYWLEDVVHTPLVSFTIRHVGAVAGVMVTASHNPAQDNGYKVYWSNGSQIIPPHDIGIANAIENNLLPLSWDVSLVDDEKRRVEKVLKTAKTAYYKTIAKSLRKIYQWPSFVYTPMHGVGFRYLSETIDELFVGETDIKLKYVDGDHEDDVFGNHTWHSVPEQTIPDPNFPTVKFPNPEEKGALNLAQKLAQKLKQAQPEIPVPLVIATDPDADRLAVAEFVNGRWHQFTGNQLGILLAHSVFSNCSHVKKDKLAMLCSTVSSGMLRAMAQKEGFCFQETLTGFKWLGNVAQDLILKEDYIVPFAFEEAIGYMFTDVVFDKDGICAAVAFLQAAAKWQKEESLTPYSKLQKLYQRYGYFADANTYLISPSPDVTRDVFNAIRSMKINDTNEVDQKHPYPSHLGYEEIIQWRDLTVPYQYDSSIESHVPSLPISHDPMITCEIERGVRFTIRASGTEPKIKLYVEGQAFTQLDAEKRALEVQENLIKEWFTPEKWGLSLPA